MGNSSILGFEKAFKVILDVVGQTASIQKIYALTYIGRNPGASQKEIRQFLGGNRPTINRLLLQMSERWRNRGKVSIGDGLIEFERDYEDNRVQRAYLTNKGQALFDKIKEALEERNG